MNSLDIKRPKFDWGEEDRYQPGIGGGAPLNSGVGI